MCVRNDLDSKIHSVKVERKIASEHNKISIK